MSNLLLPDHCYFIAEIGCNHNGSEKQAAKMIEVAKDVGADAVKFQVFQADELYAKNDPKYCKLKAEELTFDSFAKLKEKCKSLDIDFLATPFDYKCVDFLESLEVKAYKIGSGELTYQHFIKYVASKNKPIILSSGMSHCGYLAGAVNCIKKNCKNPNIILLHCTSAYPAPLAEANIRSLATLRTQYQVPVGFSDHCLEPWAAYAAVASGARVIEKHFTLSRTLPGDDHKMSVEPDELCKLIAGIRSVELSLGSKKLDSLTSTEKEIEQVARRALYARHRINAGEEFNLTNIIVRRPLHKFGADKLTAIIGEKAAHDIATDSPLAPEMFEGGV